MPYGSAAREYLLSVLIDALRQLRSTNTRLFLAQPGSERHACVLTRHCSLLCTPCPVRAITHIRLLLAQSDAMEHICVVTKCSALLVHTHNVLCVNPHHPPTPPQAVPGPARRSGARVRPAPQCGQAAGGPGRQLRHHVRVSSNVHLQRVSHLHEHDSQFALPLDLPSQHAQHAKTSCTLLSA